jgi:hypothetical protein
VCKKQGSASQKSHRPFLARQFAFPQLNSNFPFFALLSFDSFLLEHDPFPMRFFDTSADFITETTPFQGTRRIAMNLVRAIWGTKRSSEDGLEGSGPKKISKKTREKSGIFTFVPRHAEEESLVELRLHFSAAKVNC